MSKYHGRVALERYRGYWLWTVQRREILKRPYPKTLACGRRRKPRRPPGVARLGNERDMG